MEEILLEIKLSDLTFSKRQVTYDYKINKVFLYDIQYYEFASYGMMHFSS